MKTRWWIALGVPSICLTLAIGVAHSAMAQDPARDPVLPGGQDEPGAGGGLRRISPSEGLGRAQAPQVFDPQGWAEKLSNPDLDAREKAYVDLARLARRDPAARAAIEQWAASSDRPELAWTARLLRRELRGRVVGLGFGGGIDEFFQSRPDPLGGTTSVEEMLERMGIDPRSVQIHRFGPGAGGVDTRQAQEFSLQVGPDGVRCAVTEEVDGERKEKVYEAESLEALLEAHPELRDRIGYGDAGREASDPLRTFRLQGGLGLDRTPWLGRREVPTDILGVEFRKDDPRLADVPGVESGVGLYIDRVVPGTIAHILGLRRGWVLLEINGIEQVDGDDVSKALKLRKPEEALRVKVVDGEGRRKVLTWRP